MRLRFLLPFMALAACTAQGTQPTGGNPQVDRLAGPVSFDLSSWGRLLTHWQVNPDGTGEIWRGEGFGKGEGTVRKYRLRMDDAAMRGFLAASEPLRRATVAEVPCQRTITDMPYGAVNWELPGGRQTYRFDIGCRSAAADAVAERIKAVQNVIDTMAAIDAEPYATEQPEAR